MERVNRFRTPALITLVLGTLAGCASVTSKPAAQQGPGAAAIQAAATPVPRVQDCGVLDAGTPSRFVCDGKVYTSFQLARLREAEAKKYASGQ
jgi:hypothetical protein